MVPRSASSAIVMNMSSNGDYNDDRFRKKMNSKRNKDPVIQDFGSMRDWQASKTGLGRMGDDKVGDDGVSEMFGPGGGYAAGDGRMMDNNGGFDMMDRPPPVDRRPPPPTMMRNNNEDMFEGDGGNFWVNPPNNMDRYPMANGGRANTNEGMSRRRGRRGRNPRRGSGEDEDGGEFWETRREDYGDEFDDLDDEDFDYEDDYRGEYGVPPPTRSRSSFRSGAPPPPRPVKQFYDKLFWFGFDPDVTQPTDRTMFGGTRGKFNAMDMLRDRDERQRMRGGGGGRMQRGGGGRGLSRRTGQDPVVQDFGSVGDWNDRKQGRGRSGGNAMGDDRDRPNYGYESSFDNGGPGVGGPVPFPGDMPPPPPPPGMPDYDFERGYNEDSYVEDGMDFEGGQETRRRRDRGGRRRRRDNRRRDVDSRAQEYDSFLAGGGGSEYNMDTMDDEYMPGSMPEPPSSSRRQRKGFAYKYNQDDLFDYDDGEYIDVEPKYATEQDLDMARGTSKPRRRRSWEERAIEMDRVPPRGAVAWGPNGQIASGENPLDRAAMEALGDIQKSKRFLERKESKVEDAKEEVVNLKADASFCENQLEDARGARETNKLEQELGYILRDVEDASRNLRVARAERDDASNRVSELEERNWALLSEYEAARSFEE